MMTMLLYRSHNNLLLRSLSQSGRPLLNQNSNQRAQSTASLKTDPRVDPARLRNIGIVAHINAGKTTTTERILYHAGSTTIVGDVDKGNTVTDYLVQERDRGITITSAAVQFKWNKHLVNLIDTPGHVDFTFEVERSLAVLDGAITLLDASAGVEAQTITVWNQARKYQLPNLIFLNKYDKPLADFKMCLSDLKRALDIDTTLIQLPVKTKNQADKKFTSIIDIIHRQCISWIEPDLDKGNKFISEPAIESSVLNKEYLHLIDQTRELLINKLSDTDDQLASHVLECDKICDVSGHILSQAVRRATLACQLSPVLLGSSFRYIGVQQLMNAIIDYLPSPLEREQQLLSFLKRENRVLESIGGLSNSNSASAFIFKVMHDKRLGPLSYVKLLSGSLSQLQKIKVLNTSNCEQIKKIYRPFADELKVIEHPVRKHDIVILTGLKESKTGDLLADINFTPDNSQETTSLNDSAKESCLNYQDKPLPFRTITGQDRKLIIIPEINHLEPVYFCSIESKSIAQQMKLEHALNCLAREDPSFTYEIDQFGLTTIRGMGKLHLEIIRDRIESEYDIQPQLGPLQISYRETIEGSAIEELNVDKIVNSVKNNVHIKLYIRSKPKAGVWSGKMLRLDLSNESTLGKLRHDHRKAIENGIISALAHGPTLGFPLIDCDILLLEFEANRRCGQPVISSTTSQCVTNALKRCSPVLLEPMMLLEVVVPSEFNGIILGDLSMRRGLIQSTSARQNGSVIVIRANTPLSSLSNYSEFLRINTSGRGSFSMELHSYFAMSEADKQKIIKV